MWCQSDLHSIVKKMDIFAYIGKGKGRHSKKSKVYMIYVCGDDEI